jgi:hypothetical protein
MSKAIRQAPPHESGCSAMVFIVSTPVTMRWQKCAHALAVINIVKIKMN